MQNSIDNQALQASLNSFMFTAFEEGLSLGDALVKASNHPELYKVSMSSASKAYHKIELQYDEPMHYRRDDKITRLHALLYAFPKQSTLDIYDILEQSRFDNVKIPETWFQKPVQKAPQGKPFEAQLDEFLGIPPAPAFYMESDPVVSESLKAYREAPVYKSSDFD